MELALGMFVVFCSVVYQTDVSGPKLLNNRVTDKANSTCIWNPCYQIAVTDRCRSDCVIKCNGCVTGHYLIAVDIYM